MKDEEIRQARIAVDATAEGRRDLDALNEVVWPYLERIAIEMGKEADDLDWMLEIAPSRH